MEKTVVVELEFANNSLRVQLTIAAVLAFTPLLILPAWFFYFDVTPKVAVVLIGATIGLLFFLRGSTLGQVRGLWSDKTGRWFCVLTTVQLLWLLLSTYFSSNPALSWNGGTWRRFGFVSQAAVVALAFLIAASCSESSQRILLRVTAAAGFLAAVYGILQYFGLDPLLPSAGYHVGEGVTAIVRPPSTLGHADFFAGYLLYVVFLGAALAITEVQPAWKVFGVAAAASGSAAIVLSGTRGALFGLAAGAVSIWIWNRPRITRSHAVLAAGLCGAFLVFYFSPAGLKLRARVQWSLEDLRGGARLWLWRDSLRMANQRPLIGFGPETFPQEFPQYQSIELSRAYPDFYHESPHNVFLDALVSEGVPGLAILVGLAVVVFFAARRAVALGQRTAPYLAAALVAGLSSGLFFCFTLSGALYFYATVAMLIGLAVQRRGIASVPRIWRVPALALALTAAAIFLTFTIRVTASDLALARAKRDLDAGRIADSVAAYQSSRRWHPAGSSDDLYFSRTMAVASRAASNPMLARMALQQAFNAAVRAPKTSEERQNAWYNLAAFDATQNDAVDVEACLRHSIQASPNWFKPHWALAQTLLLAGQRTEALEEAGRAADLDGGKDPEIAKFLQSIHDVPASSRTEWRR
jgi:O-antigen ligase